ncbi:type I-E CRISPR-associated protein Cas7/Cse4/CasC [Rhodococcus sp. IEGM 1366]|uniref:type I-E CRISPR-associated protein Cas7/Cse4/CasC n=1 Tax=Rhodococcus sp. IEGM 1366 TaxID=3082223 RepID=UPI002955A2B2|nr:type I-E CRISPR-associated protein Cas7/Cse4/CasC [Rhodococcus sp. IEGM 1366]MDV8071119.1 type I-E CRISPR-associated protein Cas7/Cse4/CasC [Rhodococcus sp. IEGM 1366]
MSNTFIDIHILQSVPPSNINRDDTGSPKTAVFGGVRRARVSSQAWKRATRKRFNETLDKSDIGYRTKRVVELVADEIRHIDETYQDRVDDTQRLAADVLKAAGIKLTTPKLPKDAPKGTQAPADQSGYLIFLSAGQIRKLAELAIASDQSGVKIVVKDAKAAVNQDNSFDVALFGRMVADDAELNVDAAAQVAHAISVHSVANEFDYFTAVDDLQERDSETGAGMIGTVEFNSSTLYRYATVNVGGLRKNLGDDAATARAVEAFVDSFTRSMPTGKQNTFANRTLPDAIVVTIRDDQPINLAGAFEDAITRDDTAGVMANAASAFAIRHEDVARAYGTGSGHTLVVALGAAAKPLAGLGEQVSIEDLISQVGALVAERLS